eukprot:5339770-Pleurochrysis_carterae.AAC.1
MLKLRPAEDLPYILNGILLSMSIEVREKMRELSAFEQEAFLAKRGMLQQLLMDEVFTAKNALEARIKNVWPTRAMERADTIFSKSQRDDGFWKPRVLVPVPKGAKKIKRSLGIFRPLKMFRISAQSKQMKSELDAAVLTPYGEQA